MRRCPQRLSLTFACTLPILVVVCVCGGMCERGEDCVLALQARSACFDTNTCVLACEGSGTTCVWEN